MMRTQYIIAQCKIREITDILLFGFLPWDAFCNRKVCFEGGGPRTRSERSASDSLRRSFLEKVRAARNRSKRKATIELSNKKLSIRKQAELLGIKNFFYLRSFLVGGKPCFSEVWSIFAGACDGLLSSPLSDFGVISRKEDFWDLHAFEINGTGVTRRFEQVGIGEGFFDG